MKKLIYSVAIICLMGTSLNSCIGSFALYNKLLDWNQNIDNKFVNEVVFFAFWVVPVYEVSFLADVLVLNSIEFWSGTSPVAQGKSLIEGNDGKYLVECDGKGYTITSLNDKSSVRLNFHADIQTWTVVAADGEELPLMTFVDDSHMKVPTGNGGMMLIEKSRDGLYAYQQALIDAMQTAGRPIPATDFAQR